MITRRNFCAGLAGLVAAPYVIRNSGVLMPVSDRTLYATYIVTGWDGMDRLKRKTVRVLAHDARYRDIIGMHRLAVLGKTEWRNISSIVLAQTG